MTARTGHWIEKGRVESQGFESDEAPLQIGAGSEQDVFPAHRSLLGYWIVLCALGESVFAFLAVF